MKETAQSLYPDFLDIQKIKPNPSLPCPPFTYFLLILYIQAIRSCEESGDIFLCNFSFPYVDFLFIYFVRIIVINSSANNSICSAY